MSQTERTKLVVDDTTIYEIDLECQECKSRKECEKKDEREIKRENSCGAQDKSRDAFCSVPFLRFLTQTDSPE